MLQFELWKKVVIAVVVAAGFFATLPNFFYDAAREARDARREIAALQRVDEVPGPELQASAEVWPSFLPANIVSLGLDLQGGSHFVLELQTDQVIERKVQSIRDNLGTTLREAGVRRYRGELAPDKRSILVRIPRAEDVEPAGEALRGLAVAVPIDVFGNTAADLTVELQEDGASYRVSLTPEGLENAGKTAVDSAIEVLRFRVDPTGTKEPTIIRQGENRILLQLPGVALDAADLAPLLVPGQLDFHMVPDGGAISGETIVLPFDPELNEDLAGQDLRVYRKIDITGDHLVEAQQNFDQRTGEVIVSIRFDTEGGRTFARLSQNVGQRFAMVLDGKVLSAPVFRDRILGGAAQISGSFTVKSAQDLAINLSSGALPAEVKILDKAIVGPELGADSIAAGRIAAIIGFIGVLAYMGVSYGVFGLMANVALLINVMLIFGALSTLGATLTLPGIAGVVLTIGMAVDANVLVFERIREELANGRKVVSAIETGYSRALSAIIDANVTTFIAAALLYILAGPGPVRGFAVTLAIGVITSVFTAVMLTRFFVASWYDWRRPKTLTL